MATPRPVRRRSKIALPPYVSRILRLTLAPKIVEAILDARQPAEMQLDDLLEGFPAEWARQWSASIRMRRRGATIRMRAMRRGRTAERA